MHPALLAIESTDSKNAVTLDRITWVELLREVHRANPLPNHKYKRAVVLPGFAPAGLHAAVLMEEARMRTRGLAKGVAALGRISLEQALQFLQEAVLQVVKLRLQAQESRTKCRRSGKTS